MTSTFTCAARIAVAGIIFASSLSAAPTKPDAKDQPAVKKTAEKAPKKKPEKKPAEKLTPEQTAEKAAADLKKNYPLSYPPKLPGGEAMVTDTSPDFIKAPATLKAGVLVATAAPTIVFGFIPGQDHPGKPWSNWGEGSFAAGKYYSAVGDHLSPQGDALITEFDPQTKTIKVLANVAKVLQGQVTDAGHYMPGKVHSRISMGSDGWLYYATHRGSSKATTDAYGYRGDWILRTNPKTGVSEVVAAAPVPKHAIPMSGLDAKRMIFYGGTAAGGDAEAQSVQFLAYDLKARKPLLIADDGPKRAAIFTKAGPVYWDGKRYNPDTNKIEPCPGVPEPRSATEETPDGKVYGTTDRSAEIWEFDVKTEKVKMIGDGAVGQQGYVASMVVDPSGRYLYYVPGAHGKASSEGTPVVQFDVQTKKPKVIAFLTPYYKDKYNYTPDGTYSVALDDKGENLFITWNGFRTGQPRFWESCALTMIQIPASERAVK